VGSEEASRFLVDGMAVRLGKYLRCLGYDAAWEPRAGTAALARRARAEDRILLSRNTRLGSLIEPPPRWLLLASDDPVLQLGQAARAFGIDTRGRLFTRCIRCNVELAAARPEQVAARVIEPVRARHRLFFACPSCGTVFWRGSHVENTCRKLGIEPPRD
jgi:uncharacterized protein with PIN domain